MPGLSVVELPEGLAATLSVDEAAGMMGVPRSTLYQLLRASGGAEPVTARRVGRSWRVSTRSVLAFCDLLEGEAS